jgi:hypothetical protein
MRSVIGGLALTALLILPAGAARADGDLWLHVRVDSDRGEKVSVNLPLSLVEKAVAMIPDEHFRHGELVLDDIHWGNGHHLSIAELRDLWSELQASPDMTFVTVESDHETVRVSKSGGYVLVDAEESGDASAEVRIPVSVVDALLSGEGEELDIRAAIEALALHGEGELVTVNEDDERVRVWIDGSSEAD